MDFVDLFFHIALDGYGAECLGRLQALIQDIGDGDRERHLFVWAGDGPSPGQSSPWSATHPAWFVDLTNGDPPQPEEGPDDEGEGGGSGDGGAEDGEGPQEDEDPPDPLLARRGDVVRRVAEECKPGKEMGDRLAYLLSDSAPDILGQGVPSRTRVSLCGSLAEPSGNARLLGILRGFEHLRSQGLLQGYVPVFAGVGQRTATAAADCPHQHVRALAAQGLIDLQGWLASTPHPQPVYLVGEDPVAGTAIDRAAQVAVAAYGMLAWSRSIVLPAEKRSSLEGVDPFLFKETALGTSWGNRPYDSATPFAALGATAFHCPRNDIVLLLSSRICADTFEELTEQRSLGSIEDCADTELNDPEDEDAPLLSADASRQLTRLENLAMRETWAVVKRLRGVKQWREDPDDKETDECWIPVNRLRELYGPIFRTKSWERILKVYSGARFRRLPLEDWNSAIQELELLIEEGFVRRREQQIEMVSRRIVIAFLQGLDKAMADLFSKVAATDVGFEPHELAQLLLGRIYRSLKNSEVIDDELEAITPEDHKRLGEARRIELAALRGDIEGSLSAVPSPAAFALRAAPLFFACVAVFLGLPFDLGHLEADHWRIAMGVSIGTVMCLVLFQRRVAAVRRDLVSKVDHWHAQYQVALQGDDDARRSRSFVQVKEAMVDLLKWYFNSPKPQPPISSAFEILWDKPPRFRSIVEDGAELLRSQTVISRSRDYLVRARDRYREIQEEMVRRFQRSVVETVLPRIRVDDPTVFEREYRGLLKGGGAEGWTGKRRARKLRDFLRQLRTELRRPSPRGKVIREGLPFELVTRTEDGATGESAWQRTFVLPPDASLLDRDAPESAGKMFIETVERRLTEVFGESYALRTRLDTLLAAEGAKVLDRAKQRGTVTVRTTDGGSTDHFGIAAHPGDGFVPQAFRDLAQGNGRLSARVAVRGALAAPDVVYYPNATHPSTPMGLAYSYHLQHSSKAPKALEPVAPPKGGGP